VLVNSDGRCAPYIALSHCWGLAHILTTTTETLAARMEGIPPSVLPLTFQHAVQITRALNFRYLWIDSICIIQNDELDWQRESANMCNIYKNSAVTIAADAASDSTKGCFCETNVLAGHTALEVNVICSAKDIVSGLDTIEALALIRI
jgi:hypothetical protein